MTSKGGRPRLPLNKAEIIRAYQAGESQPSIARRLGIDRGRVTRTLDEAQIPRRDDRGAHWAAKREEAS